MTRQEYQIASLELEIYELTTYRSNLKTFLLLEIRKNKILAKKYNKILDEVERITIEIYELENKKSQILSLNSY